MSDPRTTPWTDADYAIEFAERAAIREYDGNLTRAEAERLATEDVAALRQAHAKKWTKETP